MKHLSSEVGQQYETYTFAYAHYAQREPGDALADIYRQGFLPYSGSPTVLDVFYLARSARVALDRFELTSENRRIAKKFDGVFEKERIGASDFVPDEHFYSLCLTYFAEKHGPGAMPRARLEYILSCGLVTNITKYRTDAGPAAYVLEVTQGDMAHYWFSFYDLSYARQSLGMWLMLDHVRDAVARGLRHYYLGTVYGQKALYKTNFEPLEWWDGSGWNTDTKLLRARGRSDKERTMHLSDSWKSEQGLFG